MLFGDRFLPCRFLYLYKPKDDRIYYWAWRGGALSFRRHQGTLLNSNRSQVDQAKLKIRIKKLTQEHHNTALSWSPKFNKYSSGVRTQRQSIWAGLWVHSWKSVQFKQNHRQRLPQFHQGKTNNNHPISYLTAHQASSKRIRHGSNCRRRT